MPPVQGAPPSSLPGSLSRASSLLGLLCLGLVLRAACLGQGLWLDEVLTVFVARADSVGGLLDRLGVGLGNHQPLYFVLVRSVTRVVGESELTLRLPTLLASTLVPFLAFLALRRPWGQRAAAAGAVLLLVHPRLVYEGQVARPYAVAEALALLALVGLGRALRDGRAVSRAWVWVPAVLALYTHKLFLVLVPALALAPVFAGRGSAYRRRALLFDVGLVFLALLPWLLGQSDARGGAALGTYWVPEVTPARIGALLGPRFGWTLLAGLVLLGGCRALSPRGPQRWPREAGRLRRAPARGIAAALAALAAGHGLLLLGAHLLGVNLVDERYATPLVIAATLLLARFLVSLPRPMAALLLGVLVQGGLMARPGPASWPVEWRDVGARVEALEPGDAPVLLWTGNAESDLLLDGRPLSPGLAALLASPLELRLAQPDRGLNIIPLPVTWAERADGYLGGAVARALAGERRALFVGHPGCARRVEGWLAGRFPGVRCSYDAPPLQGTIVVRRYELPGK